MAEGVRIVACLLLLAAALHDLGLRTVPNALALAVFAAGLALRLLAGDALAGLGWGAGVLLAAGWCWRRGWIGGGDVKLLAAAAIAMPPNFAAAFLAGTSIAGGGLALIYLGLSLAVRRPAGPRPRSLLGRLARAERWRISRRGPLPYAAAIAAGGTFILLKV